MESEELKQAVKTLVDNCNKYQDQNSFGCLFEWMTA